MTFEELRRQITLALRDDVDRAARLARRYATLAARDGDPARRAEALVQQAKVHHVRGALARAAAGYERARSIFRGLGRPRDAASTDVSAIQALALLGRGAAARRVAARIRRARLDPLLRARGELAIGSALDSLGDESGAEAAFRRALDLLGGDSTLPEAARARLNLGVRLVNRGDLQGAMGELGGALAAFSARGAEGEAAIALHDLAWAKGVDGDALHAFEDLREARRRFLARKDARRAALATLDEAELLLRLGDAEGAAREARIAARELGRGESRLEEARARLLAARAFAATGRRAAASAAARAARSTFRRAGDEAGGAMADVVLGERVARAEGTLRRRGHWLGALDALVALAERAAPGARAAAVRRIARLYPASLRRFAEPRLFRIEPGIGALRRSVRAVERLRAIAPTGALRARLLASHFGAYEALALALLARGTPAARKEAFAALDALRARTLREEMERESPGLFDSPRVRALRARLETLWRALEGSERKSGDLRAASAPLLRSLTRCERELARAVEAAERGAAPRSGAGAPLPAEPCLAYAVLDGRVEALFAARGDVAGWSCGPLAPLREALDSFRFQVTRRLHGGEDPATALAILADLEARLLPPAFSFPGGPLRLLLPPELGDAPMEALPKLARAEAFHAPGATGAAPRAARLAPALLLGIDDAALPEVRGELAWLAARLPAAETLRGGRTELLQALRRRALVHLAGHARSHPEIPILSSLRLPDGWVTASDLREADLKGALVVLSACRTGDPSLRWRGEALGGFPRALLAAGASAVVASRYEIRDGVAHSWTRELYARLDGRPPHVARRDAAEAIRARHPHPADWAAFLVISGGSLRGRVS